MGIVLLYINITCCLPTQWLSSDRTACKYKTGFCSLFLYHHFNTHVRFVRTHKIAERKKMYP
jgi:hypothetical protein